MHPDLERLQSALTAAIAGRSDEEMSRHPSGKWSAAEVLEHLYLTYTGTVKGFEKVAAAGRPLGTRPSLGQRASTLMVLDVGYFPRGRKSPTAVEPRGLSREKVLADIGPKIEVMDAIVSACERKFGARCKLLDHPVLGPLNASQWRKFHLVHGLHHVKQIRRLWQAAAGAPTQLAR